METARCEAVGARAMPGTAVNIDAKIAHEAERKGYSQITSMQDAPPSVAAGYLVRHLATGRDMLSPFCTRFACRRRRHDG